MRRRIHIEGVSDAETDSLNGEATGTNASPTGNGAVDDTLPATIPEEEAAALRDRAAELESRIVDLEKQVEQERNQYLRTLADFQNFRRRKEEETREVGQFANREMILGLLPIMDNFERALRSAEQNQNYEALLSGVALTLRQMQDFLKRNGVEPIESVGQEFDPNYHEAVMRVEDSKHPENTVVDEVQRGYKMHNRVLRPAMVKVARSE